MATEKQKQITYDIRGQICPSSLLTTLKKINKLREQLNSGAVSVEIKIDNRDAVSTIPATLSTMGYETTVSKETGYYQIIVNKRL